MRYRSAEAPGLNEIIGRAEALGAIGRLLERAAEAQASLVLEGEPGIGKTTIWEAARALAAEAGFRVLSSQPAQRESGLPLGGFGDLFADLAPDRLRDLPAPQRHAIEVALVRTEPDSVGVPLDQRALSVATTTLLGDLTGDGPVLLAIDDVQWLDPSSGAILSFALRRLTERPLAIVLTMRTSAGTSESPTVDTPQLPDGSERLTLEPLPLGALHHLIGSRIGAFPRLTLIRIEEVSGGNPFYALEIAQALVRSGAAVNPGDPLPVPTELGELTESRIRELPSGTRDALVMIAAASEPTIDVLERMGITSPIHVLRPALDDGILSVERGTVRFTHPLLSQAVLDTVDQRELRSTHAALANIVTSEDARARHLGLASHGPDTRAAEALEAAAVRARLRGAPMTAGRILEQAHALTPPELAEDRIRRILGSAVAYFEAGEMRRASTLIEELSPTLPHGRHRARALQLLGQIRARSASFPEALGFAFEALAAAEGDAALMGSIELDVALSSMCLGDLAAAAEHATRAAEREGTIPDGLLAEALAGVTMAEFMVGHGLHEERLARALALEDPNRTWPLEFRPRFVAALLRLFTGELDQAVASLENLRSEMLDSGQEEALPFLSLYLVWASLWRGDIVEADRSAQEARQKAALIGDPVTSAVSLIAAAMVDAWGGRLERAREGASEALELCQRTRFMLYTILSLWTLGVVALATGDVTEVDARLRPLASMLVATGIGDPIVGIFLPEEIEALIALGEVDLADTLIDWLERGGRDLDRAWALAVAARCRGSAAAARSDLNAAADALTEAMEQHDRVPIPIERARTLLIKGQVHRRRKEKRLADAALREALGIFEGLGSSVWAERTRTELARVGLRPRAPMDLTPTELRVAELAARGLTSRQIAEAAFLSPKTVGNVLGRVYRKLGIRSRAQLGAAMRERTQPVSPTVITDR